MNNTDIGNDKAIEKTAEVKAKNIGGILLLFITAVIWGSSFVAQSVGMDEIDAFTYNGIRCIMGGIVLIPVILTINRIRKVKVRLYDIKCGILIGLIFFCASTFQQFAFYYSTAGKIAFITALYMFLVPLIGLFFHKRISIITWICIFAGIFGLYLLSIDPSDPAAINLGDILAFLCALFFSLHILAIEKTADKTDGLTISCVQFLTAGIISIPFMFIFEAPNPHDIGAAIIPLLYSGVMSCGVAYTLQIIGQKKVEATLASMIMCLESVFAVLSSALILKEYMSLRETLGCALMFAAIIVSQFAEGRRSES